MGDVRALADQGSFSLMMVSRESWGNCGLLRSSRGEILEFELSFDLVLDRCQENRGRRAGGWSNFETGGRGSLGII